jgi:hypothetical protein
MRSISGSRTPAAYPFLELPAEIRNHVYSYCTPINGHVHEYRGLGLSCKQVRAEYKGELVRTMRKLLDRVNAKWRHRYVIPLRISMHGHLGYMASIVVKLPKSVYYRPRGDETRDLGGSRPYLEPTIPSLLQLYLKSLTITYYEDKPDPRNGYYSDISPCELARDVYVYYNGRASDRQAAFSDHYSKTALRSMKPLHTRLLRIEWLKDQTQRYRDYMRYRHFLDCSTMHSLAESNMVVDWKLHPEGFTHFKLTGDFE